MSLAGLTMSAFSQDNLIVDDGFENLNPGTNAHLIRQHADSKDKSGKRQLSLVALLIMAMATKDYGDVESFYLSFLIAKKYQ